MKKAFIFDLDGVLTDTANYHYCAWKELADSLGLKFDRAINERLKGVSRTRSFEIILEENNVLSEYSTERRELLANEKNERYKELIKQITSKDILPGIYDFLKESKKNGIKLAVASASKNAFSVLSSLGITDMFDYIADASKITKAKPDPEVFTVCAQALNTAPGDCVGFEDAAAGIQAIRSAGMSSVGINVTGETCDLALNSTSELSYDKIIKSF